MQQILGIIIKSYLIKLRDSIKGFNEIKDMSTTTEIMDGLTNSAKLASDSAEEVFDLIDQIEVPEFHMILSEKTNEYVGYSEDLISSIERAMEYINSEILGLIIISD